MRPAIVAACRFLRRPLLARMFAVACLFGATVLTGRAQSLQAQPATISASAAGFTAQAHLVLQNTGAQTLQPVSLASFSNDGITARIGRPASAAAPPQGEMDWPVVLTVPASAHLPGSVIFRAAYTISGAPRVLYAAITLQSDNGPKPVDVTLAGTPDPISQQRAGDLFLIVTNNLDQPVNVTASAQATSGGLIITPPSPFAVPAYSVAARRIALTTGFRVTPGAQDAAIDADVTWNRDGQANSRHFALTKSITVGVFFESELLKALSLPSFLALPGCLFLLTLQGLVSTGWMGLKNQSSLPKIDAGSSGFWVISFSLSAGFVTLYYVITKVNCLLTYGIADIGIMWFSSIALGFLCFVIYARWKKEWIAAHVMTGSDNELQVLRKIAANGLRLQRPGLKFKMNGVEMSGLSLENIEDGQTMVWVGPHIGVTWKQGATKSGETSEHLQERFQAEINGHRDPRKVVAIFDEAGELADLAYAGSGAFFSPWHIKVDAISGPDTDQLIVG